MNSIQTYRGIPFRGNIIIKDKNGDRTLVPAKEIKYIKETSSGLFKGVYIGTNVDNGWGDTYYHIKNIPYDKVVELYKNAMNSDDDVEIKDDK